MGDSSFLIPSLHYCDQRWAWWPRQVVGDLSYVGAEKKRVCPLNTLAAQRLLQQVRPWIEPAQSYEKNQLGLGQMFLNSLRLTWCFGLLADAAVLLRTQALLNTPKSQPALLRDLAPQQGQLNF